MPEGNIFDKETPEGANPSVLKDAKTPEGQPKTEDKPTNPDDVAVDSKTPLNKVPRFQELVQEKNEAAARVAELEEQLDASKVAKEQAPAEKTESDDKNWWEKGSTSRPKSWYESHRKTIDEAKREIYTELAENVRKERTRVASEDTALDNDLKELKDAGDFDEETEKGLLALHTDMYGNADYTPGAIKKTYEFYKQMNVAKQEGAKEGQELEQRKQVAGKSAVGAGDAPPPKGPVGGYKKLRTSSLQSLAAEAAASLLRK